MASKEPTAFERIFSRKDLFRNGSLATFCWSAASSLVLCLALVDLFLIVDLLVHRGQVRLSESERASLVDRLGEGPLAEGPAPLATPGGGAAYTNRGLLPTFWDHRDRFWGRFGLAAYRGFSPLRQNEGALVTLVAAAALFGWLRSVLDSRARVRLLTVAGDVATRVRRSLHRQTLRLGPSDLEGRGSEQAYQLFTTEADRLSEGVYIWAARMGRDPLRLFLLLTLAVAVGPGLAFVCLVPIAFCWLVAERARRRTAEAQSLARADSDRELRLLAEGLAKTRLVRGFAMENFEQEQFQKYLQRFQDKIRSALQARAWTRRAIRSLVVVVAAFVIWWVGRNVLVFQTISLAGGVLLLAALAAAWFPLQNLARLDAEVEPARTAANRIQTYLNQIPEVGQAVGAKFLQPLSRMLAFENVSYALPGRGDLLDGLSLKIPAGRQVALVSTEPLEALAVVYLLPRFIEPTRGRILIDGEDIAWVTLESLRAETIFVGGKDPFLTGTVRENIGGGGSNYSLQEVTEAAKLAHAHNFIQRLPQGYETIIGEHGEQLDAGQSFRLGLARAVLRKPALLILEEPAAALDEDTKAMLDDAYKRIAPGRTVLFLPRRLSTLKRCDEIVLIHRGRLAAIGPHARLVQSSPLYRHWEYIHFNEFRHEFETA